MGNPLPAPSSRIPNWFGVAITIATVAIFYFFVPGFGVDEQLAPLMWLESAWNSQNQFEHGYWIPFIMLGLLIWRWKALRKAVGPSSPRALPVLLIGGLLFLISHRTGQARIAIVALPMILWGSAWYLWGGKVARLTFFPLFLLLLAIPFPQLYLFLNRLDIISTHLAQTSSGWFGVEVVARGASIYSVDESFAPLEFDYGCGGNRSFLILLLIASVWASLANMALWKKALLILAVVPIWLIGNTLRLTSLFVIAKYGDSYFARGTWHDWSGLLLAYPLFFILLYATHALLKWELPKLRHLRTRNRQNPATNDGGNVRLGKRQSLILASLLGITLSTIFVLPPVRMTKSALSPKTPSFLGSWIIESYPPSHVELSILRSDTMFTKAKCGLRRLEEASYITGEAPVDVVDLAIIQSGHGFISAIYQPERTLSFQGHHSFQVSFSELTLNRGLVIPVKRILSKQLYHEGTKIDCITYSLFIGHSDIIAKPTHRTLIDLKDRVFRSADQQWSSIQASMHYLDQQDPPRGAPLTLEDADKKLRDLLAELLENNVDWSQIDK